ncbi:hemopexin repeat-containing protein [Streptomyces marincola]|uniref:hemopexin repeat-containing protein n=1 Tax=Streptomyces marincola TaxID=2878388 RepID=UPI001CF1A0D4|nr:hemopexin repeat-containing protein [Streptomyces marincola]UCM90446.1 hemopexin repeat-containing protein [Streptomyces marincola]
MNAYNGAILWPDGNAYFFSGPDYYKFDIAANRVPGGYPKRTATYWPGLGDASIHGAMVWPTGGKAYFFDRDEYYSYDIAEDKVDDAYPRPTALNWRGVLGGFQDHRIDAAVLWPNESVYFFQDDRYYRVNPKTKRVDPGYPRDTKDHWPGLWTTGQNLRGGFVWPHPVRGRRVAYFFLSAYYMRYDIENNAVDEGYPKPLAGNWPGL